MSWKITLAILLIVNTSGVIFTKRATDKIKEKSVGTFYQTFFQAFLSFGLALFCFSFSLNIPILVIGVANAFGNYFMWRALGFSISKTALFFPLMEVTSISLAVIFLPAEAGLWNFQLSLGAGLCFLAMWLFSSREENQNKKEILRKMWLFFTIAMVLIFGAAGFLIKNYSGTVPIENFLLNWFTGQFLGTLLLIFWERKNPLKARAEAIKLSFQAGFFFWAALLAIYWTYQMGGPLSLVLPLRGLSITLVPALFGLFVFKEGKGISAKEVLGFLIGIAGGILVILK